ncbi:MAG: glycosyltransferase family 4 protein [Deltaproteobacteria bacterium]
MKNLPNVLFINHSVRDGGPGRSLFYILKYLDRAKVSPWVLVPKHEVFSELITQEGLGDRIIIEPKFPENILRPRFPEAWFSIKWLGGALKALSVARNVADLILLAARSTSLIRRREIDIIYCNGTLAKILGAALGLINSRPVIWHVRNIQQARAMKFLMQRLAAFDCVKKIICVSNATAAQFKTATDKIVVIHNGVEPDDFNPSRAVGKLRAEYRLSPDTVIVGSAGRIVRRKGYDLFIEMARKVASQMGQASAARVKFVVVGDTPHFFGYNHLDTLKAEVKRLGLESHFIFTGYRRDVGEYLKDFDIFVIPSNYPDPFPRSVIEAMSFSLPVLGFKVGGIVEAVAEGETGFLSPPGDVSGLAASALRLIGDEATRRAMGVLGRERVEKLFAAKDRTGDVEQIIIGVARRYANSQG